MQQVLLNKKLIRAVKAELQKVKIADVLVVLGYSRVNLWKHLNEKRAATLNHDAIIKIAAAAQTVKDRNANAEVKKIKSLKKNLKMSA